MSNDDYGLVAAKVEQAIGLMNELDIDLWLTFAQKTGDGGGDYIYPYIYGMRDLARGLLLLTRRGERIAIVHGLDAALPPSTGVWNEVVVHRGGDMARRLVDVLERLQPRSIAINYARRNPKADGLTHGNFLWLTDALAATPFGERLVSAESLATKLRGRKLSGEVERIRAAVAATEEIFAAVHSFLRPGLTGREIYDFILAEVDRRGWETSWSRDHCPIVTVGPVAPIGHTAPGDVPLQRGWLLQIDFGVKLKGYCADFQRMWYLPEAGESGPQPEVQRLFATVRRGVDTIAEHLRPGVPSWQPAAAARDVLTGAGYPPFLYGVGHQLGRATHDGGPGLALRGDGDPEDFIEAGNVFTAEGLETLIEGRGWISLEENVLVTSEGPQLLTTRQTELWLVNECNCP